MMSPVDPRVQRLEQLQVEFRRLREEDQPDYVRAETFALDLHAAEAVLKTLGPEYRALEARRANRKRRLDDLAREIYRLGGTVPR
jgi:hypothetical protein